MEHRTGAASSRRNDGSQGGEREFKNQGKGGGVVQRGRK